MEGKQPKRNATKPTEKSVLSESVTFSCLTNELHHHYFQLQIRTLEEPRKYGVIRNEWDISFCSLDGNLCGKSGKHHAIVFPYAKVRGSLCNENQLDTLFILNLFRQ
jgi:hypothetical protein